MRADLGPEFGGLLSNGTSNGRTLSFTLVVDYHSSIVLTVEESTVGSVPSSSLSNDHSGMDFLSEFLNTLFAGAKDDISDGA